MTLISVHLPAVPQANQPTSFFELTDFEKYAIPKPQLPVEQRQHELILYFHDHEEMLDYYSALIDKRYYEQPQGEPFQKMKVIIDHHAPVYQFELVKDKLRDKTYLTAENGTPYRFSGNTLQIGDQTPLKFHILQKPNGFYLEYGPKPQVFLIMDRLNTTFELKTPDGKLIAHLHPEGEHVLEFLDL